MKNLAFVFFAVVIFLLNLASAQIILGANSNIFINEFESNPANGSEWVELYNDENFDINIGNWKIYDGLASVTLRHTVPNNTVLASRGFYTANVSGLNNDGEFIILKDNLGEIIDQTPELADNFHDDRTWSRVPDGRNNSFVFQPSTRGYTNIPTLIENKSINLRCVIEGDRVTLNAQVSGICIEEVIFSVFSGGEWNNFSGANSAGNNYFAIIPGSIINESGNMSWTVFARNCFNDTKRNGIETFYVNSKTRLSVNPASPDGLNGWYVSEPEFNLLNPDTTRIFYQWDASNITNFSAPFGLENTPNNAAVTGGVINLNFWSDVCFIERMQNESMQTEFFKFDFRNPRINELTPRPNSSVQSAEMIEISAEIDDVFGSNSGINLGSVKLYLDNEEKNANISRREQNVEVLFLAENLSVGRHHVRITANDNSGRMSEANWSFNVTSNIFDLTVYSPEEIIYNTTRVQFNLSVDNVMQEISYINYNDRTPRIIGLCRNCDEFGLTRRQIKTVNEGVNNVTFMAINELDNAVEKNVVFVVDSKAPRILRTEPTRGFTSGIFSLTFDEKNPLSVFLTYGNDSDLRNKEINLNSCFDDRGKTKCEIEVNLEEFHGMEINYWFNITDILNRTSESRKIKVEADAFPPLINSFNYSIDIDRRRVNFVVNITEENFKEVSYIDFEENNPRVKKICTRLRDGICAKTVSFRRGEHSLYIFALDKAGNEAVVAENLNFSIS